jgi:hypothetical protein
MKMLVITLALMGAIATSTSCSSRQERNAGASATNDVEQRARKYLQPMLQIGESPTNLIEQYGLPFYQYELQNHDVSMSFHFSDMNQAARAAGVAGFTAFVRSNQLNSWDPIYQR